MGPALIVKRQCYGIDPTPVSVPSSKRQRTASVREATRSNPFPLPQLPPLKKEFYSKADVHAMLEEMEQRYTQQLDVYCASVFDLLYPKQSCPNDSNNHHMAYIS
jgi:hypothetical protein